MVVAIRVEGLGKLYRLGEIGTGSLAHDVNRWWHRIRGKEDPYTLIGERNDRTREGGSRYVWALKNVQFDIEQGEVVGIIGRNGAGKSTLLKILSRVTSPTRGIVRARGRIASLLEVGTGFHPELTGRDNIFLNGAILGMRRHEITRKLDEIIEFSGCQRYIDTPVKRYSSGMHVRLAFAVAAHLDPEIMIIDEVLAVGDGDFQRRCIGKMRHMHVEGRTVIIVSHQMTMITSLCDRGILLKDGELDYIGSATDAVLRYQPPNSSCGRAMFDAQELGRYVGDERAELHRAWVERAPDEISQVFDLADPITIKMIFTLRRKLATAFYPNFHVFDSRGEYVFCSAASRAEMGELQNSPGRFEVSCEIPANLLNTGMYSVGVAITCMDPGVVISFFERDAISFQVTEDMETQMVERRHGYAGPIPGPVRPVLKWSIESCKPIDMQVS